MSCAVRCFQAYFACCLLLLAVLFGNAFATHFLPTRTGQHLLEFQGSAETSPGRKATQQFDHHWRIKIKVRLRTCGIKHQASRIKQRRTHPLPRAHCEPTTRSPKWKMAYDWSKATVSRILCSELLSFFLNFCRSCRMVFLRSADSTPHTPPKQAPPLTTAVCPT